MMEDTLERSLEAGRERFDRVAAVLYRRRRKLLTSAVALLACWVAYHVVFGANGMVVYAHKRSEYKALQADMEKIKAENERLAKEVQSLKSDPKTIEREARERMGYARPGEVIYTLPTRPPQPSTATAQKQQP